MTTLFILFIALIVLIGVWAIIGLNKKTELKEHTEHRDHYHEFATEIFPESEPKHPEKELPPGYDDNAITLMVRDPNWLYVYWEISHTKREELKRQYGERIFYESQPILRVYDITAIEFDGANDHRHFDVMINDYANNWYIKVDQPNCTFCVDIGRILGDGSFVHMARSNYGTTPRNHLSDKIDPEWMMIGELFGGNISYGLSSPELFGVSSDELIKKDQEH